MGRIRFHTRTEPEEVESVRGRGKIKVCLEELKLKSTNNQVSCHYYFIPSNCDNST